MEKCPINNKQSPLGRLLNVIAYADKYKVKNVQYHLKMQTVVTLRASYNTYYFLKKWADEHKLDVEGAFTSKLVSEMLAGIVIRTPERKCRVFVYYD